MIRMISRVTGSVMWVHESRVEEYLERGHKLAPPPEPPKPKRTRKPKAEK